jgi:alcohol dehydrogenase class IV
VLGGRYPIPHGVCCALLLPHVIQGNVKALQQREPSSDVLARYVEVAQLVAGQRDLDALIEQVTYMCAEMKIPTLSAFGVTREAVPQIVEQAQQASSMKANPIKLTAEELTEILTAAL